MRQVVLPDPDDDSLRGRRLYGNDFTPEQLAAWYAAEEYGFFDLYGDGHAYSEMPFPYQAWARIDAAALGRKRFDKCVALGCADGRELAALGLDLGSVIGVEPAEQFWSESVARFPIHFRKPTTDGSLDLPDGSIDLAVALHVLHHVANVSHVVAEMGRVLKPGGMLLLREPIVSMGDFRLPRPGLTRHERGIPVALMRGFIADAGLKLSKLTYRSTPGMPELAGRLGIAPFNSAVLTRLDEWISRITRFNDRYWRPALWHKLAPRTVTYIAVKPL